MAVSELRKSSLVVYVANSRTLWYKNVKNSIKVTGYCLHQTVSTFLKIQKNLINNKKEQSVGKFKLPVLNNGGSS